MAKKISTLKKVFQRNKQSASTPGDSSTDNIEVIAPNSTETSIATNGDDVATPPAPQSAAENCSTSTRGGPDSNSMATPRNSNIGE
eukprot:scaffold2678_cov78-Skeletonema_marinoi.AAC.1